ncbi:MAG: hypothetical protein Q4B04_05370 [bacterium]|nr:hypothetical protein [bacterium]
MPINKYRFAELNVEMETHGDLLDSRAEKYLYDFSGEPDISIHVPVDFIKKQQKDYPYLTFEELDYLITGAGFYFKLSDFNGFMLHSSTVVYNNKAYMFSAPCGTGKSTHTSLWRKYLGEENTYILNDDKPAIRIFDDGIFAYGTPFSGKTSQSENKKVEIGGIVFVERATSNSIARITNPIEAIGLLNWQSNYYSKKERISKKLTLFEEVINRVPLYKLSCDISQDAFITSFECLTGQKFQTN